MTRLFIGTFVSQSDQEKIGALQQQNSQLDEKWKRKIRWVKPEKLHMTWLFLGAVGDDLIQPVSDMLANLVAKELGKEQERRPMKISFEKCEIWPDARKPRQVVIRPDDVDERIMNLARTLRNGLLEFYFDQSEKEESRSFRPHVTLLRVERRQQEPQRFTRPTTIRLKTSDIEGVDAALPVVLNLDKIALVESHMGKNSTYQILHEVPIASPR
jgi:2'-5' RNA ligase